jgi:hypothetical protein
MRIVDAHTGRDVRIGTVLPVPGGPGTYQVVELRPDPLTIVLNLVGYALFRKGLVQPAVRVRSADPNLNDKWIPLVVNLAHPAFPGQVVAFIPS